MYLYKNDEELFLFGFRAILSLSWFVLSPNPPESLSALQDILSCYSNIFSSFLNLHNRFLSAMVHVPLFVLLATRFDGVRQNTSGFTHACHGKQSWKRIDHLSLFSGFNIDQCRALSHHLMLMRISLEAVERKSN